MSRRFARRASRRPSRAASVRVGFHLYNDEEDADRVADVLQTSLKAIALGRRLDGARGECLAGET